MKNQISYRAISISFSVLVICFAVGFYAFGWQEPTDAPPGGNIPTPINSGSSSQVKVGGLRLQGVFVVDSLVGIGTLTPSSKLDVNGAIKATGFQMTTGAGAGKVLTSDASGVATWQVSSGGGGGSTSGSMVGSGYVSTNATTQITAIIDIDNTIPQISEGQEVLSLNYTPKFSDSLINIEVVINAGGGGDDAHSVIALFRQGTSNALSTVIAGDNVGSGDGHWSGPIVLRYQFTPGSVSPITFKVRMGGAVCLNRQEGNIYFGGTMRSHMYVTEVRP